MEVQIFPDAPKSNDEWWTMNDEFVFDSAFCVHHSSLLKWAKLKWLSSGLPNRMLRVQIPSLTPNSNSLGAQASCLHWAQEREKSLHKFDIEILAKVFRLSRGNLCRQDACAPDPQACSFNRQNAGLQNRSSPNKFGTWLPGWFWILDFRFWILDC